ncbi:MAG TPA: hypothetical protein VJ302_20370, partial [Blastocatellia bacterium]|nr:hypothetical protein [Blastocatellia bacterium]
MKITLIMVLLTCLPGSQQVDSLERQALETVQRMPVSKLDPMLPGSSFATWFNKVVGPGAGVVWQLTECGERIDQQKAGERDLNACLEADAILADGRKVVVAIGVGTFKKGFSGEPVFHSAVIEQDNQLYEIRKLHNLPQFLYSPRVDPIRLPEVAVDLRLARRHSELESFSPTAAASSSYPASPMVMVEPDAAPSDPQPV